MLYESALLTSGFSLDDPVQFANRIHGILEVGLNVNASEFETVKVEENLQETEKITTMETVD